MKATKTPIQASPITCPGSASTAMRVVRKVAGVDDACVELAAQILTFTHQTSVAREALASVRSPRQAFLPHKSKGEANRGQWAVAHLREEEKKNL
jgi:copper chaperone CopZ